MNNRVTLISILQPEDLNKICKLVIKSTEKLCKVPFSKYVEDRVFADTLPYHFTLSAWDISEEHEVINKLSSISFNNLKLLVDGIEIMNGKENSYVLYFNIKDNDELKLLQKSIYQILPSEKYNPERFKFHITIHIDKDYEKIISIRNALMQDFIPFELEVDTFGLFEIYPANLVAQFKSN